jgi:hypothetical protein
VGFQNNTAVDFLLFDHLAVQGSVSGAPEPNTLPLLALGGMALGFLRVLRLGPLLKRLPRNGATADTA